MGCELWFDVVYEFRFEVPFFIELSVVFIIVFYNFCCIFGRGVCWFGVLGAACCVFILLIRCNCTCETY